MLNIYLLKHPQTMLADEKSLILTEIERVLKNSTNVNLDCDLETADAIVFQEKFSFKEFRYIKKLEEDKIISKYLHKIFTINVDDCATGLLKGLYTSLPARRFKPSFHVSVPYDRYPNEMILKNQFKEEPIKYLAGWRGNPSTNSLRPKIIKEFKNDSDISIQSTYFSWADRRIDEKSDKSLYVRLIKNSKFSLCPSGWAPVSFRIYESMALGRCPVIISDQFVPPEGPNWEDFSIFHPENKIHTLKKALVSKEIEYKSLGDSAYKNWVDFFSPSNVYSYYVTKLLALIEKQKSSKITSQIDFKTMKSYHTYHSNGWLLHQRIFRKIFQLSKKGYKAIVSHPDRL